MKKEFAVVKAQWIGVGAALLMSVSPGCDNNPVKDKSVAKVEQPAQPPVATNEAGVRYPFSEVGSEISWVGAKVTRKHDGSFRKFSGQIAVVDGDVTKSSVTANIETASITADDEQLVGHLKSPDFFDVNKFPVARFQSTKIETGGERGATHTVTGNLELHGVKKSIRFPASITLAADKVTVKSEFGLNRKDFGIVYPGKPDDLIKDEVLIRLNLVATKS